MPRIPTEREPTHPGEMLMQEFLLPLGVTQRDLAASDTRSHLQHVNAKSFEGYMGLRPSMACGSPSIFGTPPPISG